jgi:hypothetical protein
LLRRGEENCEEEGQWIKARRQEIGDRRQETGEAEKGAGVDPVSCLLSPVFTFRVRT